jgi:hypothetical protein
MPISVMLRRVAPVRTNVSEERIASIIGVTRIGKLGTLAVITNRSTLRRNHWTTHVKQTKKKPPWPLVRERTIPTERPPPVDEI